MGFQWPLAVTLHQLGTIIWVGGMFFAHFALRPAAAAVLDPPRRLPLLCAVFQRFFPWVGISIFLLWTSGLWLFLGPGARAGLHVHLMMGIGGLMTLIFLYIWLAPFRGLRSAVASEDWPLSGRRVASIRKLLLVNLLLGLLTAVLGASGPFLLALLA